MSDPLPTSAAQQPTLEDHIAGRTVDACPVCFGEMSDSCRMTYTFFQCWSCGVTIDSRVASPVALLRTVAAEKHAAWERGEEVV